MGAGLTHLAVDKADRSSHLAEQALIQKQLALNTAMKSPQSGKKTKLQVSFMDRDVSSERASNEYARLPTANTEKGQNGAYAMSKQSSYGTRIKYTESADTLSKEANSSQSNGYHKIMKPQARKMYMPTHIPPQHKQGRSTAGQSGKQPVSGVSHSGDYVDTVDSTHGSRYQLYDENQNHRVPLYSSHDRKRSQTLRSENSDRTSSLSRRRQRARSVSPRRRDRIVIQGPLSRSDIENLKNVIRSAQRSASTSRK